MKLLVPKPLSFRLFLLQARNITGRFKDSTFNYSHVADKNTEPFAEDFNVVINGNFNPSIFHPEWFHRNELIGAETALTAKVAVVSPQITEIDIGYINLQCTDNRLIIRSSRASHTEMLHDLVRGILNILPHTPITSCGINHEAHYPVGDEEQWHSIGHNLAPKDPVWNGLCENPGMLRLTILSPKTDWDSPLEVNLTVEPIPNRHPKHPAIIVRANTHFNLPKENPAARGSQPEIALKFLDDCWEESTTEARRIAAKIFESFPST